MSIKLGFFDMFREEQIPTRVGGGNLDPQVGNLAVTAGWGHAGKGGVTMPGKGKSVLGPYTPEERAAVERGGLRPWASARKRHSLNWGSRLSTSI